MSTPFREDAVTLASVDAKPVISKWDAEKIPFGLRLALLVLGKMYAPVREGDRVAPKLSGAAEGLGFVHLGRYRFAGLLPFFGPVRDAWTDRDGVVRVSFRRDVPHGPIEATMGAYLLTTNFDDGTAITTSSSQQIDMPPSTLLTNRSGIGDLVADYAAHRAAIAEHASDTRHPLHIPDLDTAIAISAHHDRRLSPWAIVVVAQARFIVFFVMALAVGLLVHALRP